MTKIDTATRPVLAAGPADPAEAAPAGTGRHPDRYTLAVLLVLLVLAPALVAVRLHTFTIPQNDDWAYRQSLFSSMQAGHLVIVPWGAMTLVGQLLWAVPFVWLVGSHAWAPGVAAGVLACLGLAAAYWLARQVLARPRAVLCVLLLGAAPGFLFSTSDFMTDVPAFSAQMICLAAGARALRSQGWRHWAWVLSSMLAGVFGFAIRDFAIAAPAAVLLVMVLSGRRPRQAYGALGAAVLLACWCIYIVSKQAGSQPSALQMVTPAAVCVADSMYFTLSFCLLPLIPAAARRFRGLSWPAVLVGLVAVAMGVEIYVGTGSVFVGNYLLQSGALGPEGTSTGRPGLFPGPLWAVLNIVAIGAGASLVVAGWGAARAWARHPAGTRAKVVSLTGACSSTAGLLAVFAVLVAAATAAYCLFAVPASYDRYLYPLIFPLAVLLARPRARRAAPPDARRARRATPWVPGALGLLLAVSAVLVALNFDAYGGALWAAGKVAVAQGLSPYTVNAGFAWRGWYPDRNTYYCGSVTNFLEQPDPHWYKLRLVRTMTYDEIGFAIPEHLYVYVAQAPGCHQAGP